MDNIYYAIVAARKGKRRVSCEWWMLAADIQNRLTHTQYRLFWRVDAEEVNYIDKGHIISGPMNESTFNRLDSAPIRDHLS